MCFAMIVTLWPWFFASSMAVVRPLTPALFHSIH
jgi:hypothetical protein